MKKIVMLLTLCAFVFVTAGCGGGSSSTASGTPEAKPNTMGARHPDDAPAEPAPAPTEQK